MFNDLSVIKKDAYLKYRDKFYKKSSNTDCYINHCLDSGVRPSGGFIEKE